MGYMYFTRVGLSFVRNNGGSLAQDVLLSFCIAMDDGPTTLSLCNDIYSLGLNFEDINNIEHENYDT